MPALSPLLDEPLRWLPGDDTAPVALRAVGGLLVPTTRETRFENRGNSWLFADGVVVERPPAAHLVTEHPERRRLRRVLCRRAARRAA